LNLSDEGGLGTEVEDGAIGAVAANLGGWVGSGVVVVAEMGVAGVGAVVVFGGVAAVIAQVAGVA
jgi:hypothetical protein